MGFIMVKKTNTDNVNSGAIDFTDLSDLGYKQASTHDASVSQAKYAIANIAGFPETVPDEARSKLYVGYRRRFAQNNPAVIYAIVGGHYVQASPEHIASNSVEKAEIGVDYAFSFTAQEFGKLANTNPALHGVIKKIRDKTTTYCSNRLGDLKRAGRKILNEGKERKRTGNKNFSEYVDSFFDDAATRLKSAKARGDSTANEERFNKAKAAFITAWRNG